MPLYLIADEHPDSPVPLDKPVLLFGRQADCDVIVTCSRKVSRRHCCVAQITDWFVVRDLGSTNGVSVNGKKIAREAKLQIGDELTIGDVTFALGEGTYDVPKGKVTVGPPLKSGGGRKKAIAAKDEKRQPPGTGFKGIASSRPNRSTRKADESARPSRKSRSKQRAAEELVPSDEEIDQIQDDVVAADSDSDADVFQLQPDSGAETAAADDAPLSDEDFGFLDDDDADDVVPAEQRPQSRRSKKKRKPEPYRPSRSPLAGSSGEQVVQDPFVDDAEDDGFVYEDEDEAASKPKPPARKRRPADDKIRVDEELESDAEVKQSGGRQGMDSIIELDEFDLLD